MSMPRDAGDWTRWNRSGLGRFQYVGHNAATLLEALRLEARRRFTPPDSPEPQWKDLDVLPPAPDESGADTQDRLLRQYRAERRDFGWEIFRALARSLHVLGGHLDAYANEGYLETATQWESLRKLVAMLNYRPAPPASASTTLVLIAKAGKSAIVPAGLAVKNVPEDGAKPSVFETRADLALDWRLNALHPLRWNRSQLPFEYADLGGSIFAAGGGLHRAEFPLAEIPEGVAVHTRGVLVVERPDASELGFAVRVESVGEAGLTLLGQSPGAETPFPTLRHRMRLLLAPGLIRIPQLSGTGAVSVSPGHGLVAKDVVAWEEGKAWKVAKVDAVDGGRLRLSGPDGLPPPGKSLKRAQVAVRQIQPVGGIANLVLVPLSGQRETATVWDDELHPATLSTFEDSEGNEAFQYSTSALKLFYLPKAAAPAAPIVASAQSPQDLSFPGDPGDMSQGDWVVSAAGDGMGKATRVTGLSENDAGFVLDLEDAVSHGETLYAGFAHDLRPAGYDRNLEALSEGEEKSDGYTVIPLESDAWMEGLERNRLVVIRDGSQAWAARISAVDAEARAIRISPPIPGTEANPPEDTEAMVFLRWNTTIAANAAEIGHGETKPVKTLGNGDAARSGQSFHLDVRDVSFVADPAFPSGVRADLEVQVDARVWEQAPDLVDSAPEDTRYQVNLREDGTLDVTFGDGRTGRRLPTGRNNVRVGYRVGGGLSGNLPAGSLVKIARPHPALERVEHPLPATGGNDRETPDSLRENAPPSVLALDRAVSLADFGHLAARYSGVWQAHAYLRPDSAGKAESVYVAVVPAGGGALGDLAAGLQAYLLAHTLPGVAVQVVNHQPVAFDLRIEIRVDTEAFDPEDVAGNVRASLLAAFSLSARKLGGSLYVGEIFAVVENVTGVENAHCAIPEAPFLLPDGSRRVRHLAAREGSVTAAHAGDQQVIFLDPETSVLDIVSVEFSL